MSTEEIIYILQNNTFIFQQNSMIMSFLRLIGWGLSKFFINLASATSSLFDAVFGFLSFTDDNGVLGSFVKDFRPVVFAILIVSIFALGVLLIIKHEKKPQLLQNILIFVLVVTSCGYVMNLMNEVIVSGKNAIVGQSSSDVAYQTAAADIYDLVYIDSQHGGISFLLDEDENKKDEYGTYDTFTSKDLSGIDINEVLNYNSTKYGLSDEVKSVLKKKIVYFHDNSLISTDDVYAGFGINFDDTANWFNEFYYRYSVDFVPLWISMIALIIIYVVMAYKVFRLIFELGVMRIVALVTSANITGGTKVVKTLDAIKNSYIVILVCCMLIRFYQLACTAMNDVDPIANNGLIKAFCRLFLAFAVVDGPNLIEWLFGIDAGLQSGVGRIMAAWHIGKGVGYAAGKGVKKTKEGLSKLFGGGDKTKGKEGADVFNNISGDDKTKGMDRSSPDPNKPTGGGAAANQIPGGVNEADAMKEGAGSPDGALGGADKDPYALSGDYSEPAAGSGSFDEAMQTYFPEVAEKMQSVGFTNQNANSVLNGTDAYGNAVTPGDVLKGIDSATENGASLNGMSNVMPDGKEQRANAYSGAIFKDKSIADNTASKMPGAKPSSKRTTGNRQMPKISSDKQGNSMRKEKFHASQGEKNTSGTKNTVKKSTKPVQASKSSTPKMTPKVTGGKDSQKAAGAKAVNKKTVDLPKSEKKVDIPENKE